MRRIAFLLAALLAAFPAGAEVKLRAIAQAPLLSLDPIRNPDYVTTEHGYLVYDTLFALDAGLAVRPQMAESEQVSPDGLTHTITLREGLRFHDGAPVTPEDCIASIERWAAHDMFGQALKARIRAMRVTGPRSFAIALDKPFPLLSRALAKPTGPVPFIMPAKVIEAAGDRPIDDATGSGPFRLARDSFTRGHYVLYDRNPGYKPRPEPPSLYAGGKAARIDRLEWVFVPDDASAAFELYAGIAQYWATPTPIVLPGLAKNDDVALKPLDPLGQVLMLRLNHRVSPFADPRLRRAARLAIDQAEVLAAIAPLVADKRACASVFPCGLPGASSATAAGAPAQRRAEAKRLLIEAGYAGKPIVLLTARDQQIVNVAARAAAGQLRAAGFAVEIVDGLWTDLVKRRAETAGWSAFVTRWPALDLASPAWNRALRAPKDQPAAAWFGWPEDAGLEALREKWLDSVDPDARRALVNDIEAAALQSVPYVPLGQFRAPVGYRTTLKGLVPAPSMVLWGVEQTD